LAREKQAQRGKVIPMVTEQVQGDSTVGSLPLSHAEASYPDACLIPSRREVASSPLQGVAEDLGTHKLFLSVPSWK
jgi:hypothetical protein